MAAVLRSTTESKERIFDCIEKFKKAPYVVLSMLNLQFTNGHKVCSFTEAYCEFEEGEEYFQFLEVFQVGMVKLTDYLLEGNDGNFTKEEVDAFECLIDTFKNIEMIEECLCKDVGKKETAIAVQLAHHLLSPLCSNKNYKLDHYQRKRIDFCECCKEKITGSYEDTSIGNGKLWHGRIDILMNNVPVTLDKADEDGNGDNSDAGCVDFFPISSVGMNASFLEINRNQLIAETIVFAFIQQKLRSSAKDFLTPTIAISEGVAVIYFYDPENDYFLTSSYLYLFDSENEIHDPTILALWLTLNYTITCSGLTDTMLKCDFKSDFLKHFNDKVKNSYKTNMHFGVVGREPNLKVNPCSKILSKPVRSILGRPKEGFPSFKTEKIDNPFKKAKWDSM